MPGLTWRSGAEVVGDGAMVDDIAAGVHEAGNPLYDYLFGSAAAARAAILQWVRRPTSEVYAGRARLLFEGDALVGGYIAMPGAECRACRMADGAALLALARGAERPALLARMAGLKGAAATLADDDWYVSKMWVRPQLRGNARGYAITVSKAAMDEPAPGLRKIAEASADNVRALKVYGHLGCVVVQRNTAANGLQFLVFRLASDLTDGPTPAPGAEPGLTWRPGAAFLRDEAVMEEIVAGVLEAGNPYFEYLFGGAAEARSALQESVRRPTSEVYAGRATLLLDRGEVVGGVIAMPGAEARRCRLADAAALHLRARGAARARMVARIEKVKGLFAPIEKDDWYASKLWVRPDLRGKGYAIPLARAAFFPDTPPRGRSIGDVAAGNAPALHIYTKHLGCEIVGRNASPSGLEYVVIVAPKGPVTARGSDRPR